MNAARELRFEIVETPEEAVLLLLRVRFAECLALQAGLVARDDEALHAFRLACKRLRYAIVRFAPQRSDLEGAAAFLGRLTRTLGSAHDCALLSERALRGDAVIVARRARSDRDRFAGQAQRAWHRAFRRKGALGALAAHTGFTWDVA